MIPRIIVLGAVLLAAPVGAGAGDDQKKAAAASTAAEKSDAQFDQFEGELSKSEAKPVSDPLRGYNRTMFWINDKFYFFLGKPLTKIYSLLLPQPVRVAVDRAFVNLAFPVRFVSTSLHANFNGTGREVGRFLVNSTLGIGGLFDPAEKWMGIKPADEDLGLAFGHWGIGTGFPIVLPILGQTNLRDGIGMAPTFLLNPVYYATSYTNYIGVVSGGKFNYLSLHGEEYEKIKKDALDPYTFIRDAHLQNREKKLKGQK